jgi:hypothetical protein
MTVVLTIGSPSGVVMATDSAVTRDFGSFREYDTERKLWHVAGVGFVSTWGARDGNRIGPFLEKQWADKRNRTVDDLARSIHGYLIGEFRPDEAGLQDVGFHIAGVRSDGGPAVYHSYFHTPRDATSFGSYDLQMIGPRAETTQFLYNGRNDIVHSIVATLIAEGHSGADPRFRGESIGQLAHLSHFVLRMASEITPGVGAPYIICAKFRDGREIKQRYDQVLIPLTQFEADFPAI